MVKNPVRNCVQAVRDAIAFKFRVKRDGVEIGVSFIICECEFESGNDKNLNLYKKNSKNSCF